MTAATAEAYREEMVTAVRELSRLIGHCAWWVAFQSRRRMTDGARRR